MPVYRTLKNKKNKDERVINLENKIIKLHKKDIESFKSLEKSLRQTIENLQAELYESNQKLVQKDQEIEDLRTDKSSLTEWKTKQNKRIDDQRKEIKKLKQDKEEIQKSWGELDINFKDLQLKFDDLQHHFNESKKQNLELEKKISVGNSTITRLTTGKSELEDKISSEKQELGIQWAKELAPIITRLSSLAELDPEPVKLTPRSILEGLLDWMEKVFGARPKTFPGKRELLNGDSNSPKIMLDADQVGLETLLSLYDWSPDNPFSDLPEGSKKRNFRILHWGWKVKDHILVKVRVFPLPIEVNEKLNQEGKNAA